jgi:hypothetical protein
METSASPFFKVNTASVPAISSFNRGCDLRHPGNLGISQRAAKAFVAVTRSGVPEPGLRTVSITLAKDSKPSRTTGKSCSPLCVSAIGLGWRRNKAQPQ